MSEADDSGDKTYDPTPERLKKARSDGQVVKSTDLNTAAAYLGMAVVAFSVGPMALQRLAAALMTLLSDAPRIARELFGGGQPVVRALGQSALMPIMVWFLLPACCVLMALIAQRAIVVTPKNLAPKMSRISILSNAKQKFGRSGLFEFAKGATKLCSYCLVAWFFIAGRADEILLGAHLEAPQVAQLMMRMLRDLLIYVVVLTALIGAIDYLWLRAEHMRKNMMSRRDLQDETKDSEGDPEHKQRRRLRAQEIALNSMLADVAEADVVVVNPTHYAVALQWDRSRAEPPRCVAKGVDEIAARIRERAAEHGVPVHSDPSTARALHATLDIGDVIDPEHFVAVAAAIRFADEIRKKARML